MASEIAVISSMATKEVLAELAPAFERVSPHRVKLESAGGIEAAERVRGGEALDLVVLAQNAIDQLIAQGKLVAGSRVDLAKSGVTAAVRSGAPRPDISSEDAVKRAVQSARTIGYSTGPSGTYLAKLFERWGIAEEIRGRLVVAPPGVPVGTLIAKGDVELGFQQLSELIHIPGITVLGPLPPAIQVITTFSAGRPTVSTKGEAALIFLDFVNSPAAAVAKRKHGLEPA